MRRAIKFIGILLALLIVVALAVPLFLDADQFRPLLQTKLSAALGRQVTLGNLKLSLFSGSVTASDLSIADDPQFSKSPFLRASSLGAGVEMMPLIFSRKLNVTGVTIDRPQIDLVQNAQGVWNFSSIGGAPTPSVSPAPQPASAAAPDLSVQEIKISNGRITMAKLGSRTPPLVLDKLNIEVKDFSATAPFTFSLAAAFSGGGDIKLDGKAGPINAGNAIATPLTANLHITHLDLALSGAVDPALGLAGLAAIEGSVESSGAAATVTGKLKGEQLKLAKAGQPAKRPLEVDFTAVNDLKNHTGTLRRGDIHLGGAVASLTGTYNAAHEPAEVDLKLAGTKLDVTDLGAFLPALDVVLPAGATIEQGTAEINLTAQGPADKLVEAGTVGFDGVRLANYDLATKMKVLDELAGIKAGPHTEIQTFHATVRAEPGGTTVQDIDLIVPSIGEMTGEGTISPAHELAFKMRAALKAGAGALAGLGSKGGIPFTISGTSESPSFKPDVKGMAKDKLSDITGGLTDGLFGKKKK